MGHHDIAGVEIMRFCGFILSLLFFSSLSIAETTAGITVKDLTVCKNGEWLGKYVVSAESGNIPYETYMEITYLDKPTEGKEGSEIIRRLHLIGFKESANDWFYLCREHKTNKTRATRYVAKLPDLE